MTTDPNTPPALSREDVERILALAEKAAPGPWVVRDENEGEQRSFWTVVNADFDKEENPNDPLIPLQAAMHYGAKDDADFIAACDPQTVIAICQAALRYLKLRDGNVVACYTVPPDDTQPGVRISGPALDEEVDK